MAKNCCDRDRTTWLDMHSSFKMAQIFFPFVLDHFEVRTFWSQIPNQNGQFRIFFIGKMGHFQVWGHFEIWAALKFEAILKFWAIWSSNLKMAQNERDKILGPFWSLNAYQVTWSYLCHSSLGPFEVYLVFGKSNWCTPRNTGAWGPEMSWRS